MSMSVISRVPSLAAKMSLPAFAAERRAAARATAALDCDRDVSLLCCNNGTDKRTDGRTPCR